MTTLLEYLQEKFDIEKNTPILPVDKITMFVDLARRPYECILSFLAFSPLIEDQNTRQEYYNLHYSSQEKYSTFIRESLSQDSECIRLNAIELFKFYSDAFEHEYRKNIEIISERLYSSK